MKLGIDDKLRDDGSADFDPPGPKVEVRGLAASIGARNLMIIIITMPLVFLVVVMAIIAIFGKPSAPPDAAASGAARPAPAAALEQPALTGQRAVSPVTIAADDIASAIVLPPGAAAGAISLDGDRLALRVDSDDGAMIVIYDLAEGAVVQTIPVTTDETN